MTEKHIKCYDKSPVHPSDHVVLEVGETWVKETKCHSDTFQIQLSSISKMDLTEKKGYLTIALSVHKEGRILLRSSLGIREWFLMIKV